jgi:hypothetical protein
MKIYYIVWEDGRVSEYYAQSKKQLKNILKRKGFSKGSYRIE